MVSNVSVVIPLFNKEFSIRRTIASVLAQTHQSFELLIINDGSTDNSLHEADTFTDLRVRIITQPNAGECAARNRGIYEAKYDLVAFLDADDEWDLGFLEKIIELRDKYLECQVFATSFRYMTDDPAKMRKKPNPYAPGWEGVITDYFRVLKTYTPFFPSSIAVKKETLIKLGGFKEGVKLRGDMEMWFRLALTSRIAYANIPLALYHLDAENRVSEVFKDEELILGEHLVTLHNYIKNRHVPGELLPGAIDYLSFSQLNFAGSNLNAGNTKYALRILLHWQYSRTYLRRWMRLFYYCLHSWFFHG
jgi:glycosyltransferase involved in cell wall biosynthesis